MATRHFRAHQRFTVRIPVTIVSINRSVTAKGFTVNLGIGGSACELDTPLRLGETIDLKLEFEQPLRIQATVAWVGWAESSAVRLGVHFAQDDAELLGEILETLGVSAGIGA